jgi:hypothetical protein
MMVPSKVGESCSWGGAVIEHLLGTCEALGSIPSTVKKV